MAPTCDARSQHGARCGLQLRGPQRGGAVAATCTAALPCGTPQRTSPPHSLRAACMPAPVQQAAQARRSARRLGACARARPAAVRAGRPGLQLRTAWPAPWLSCDSVTPPIHAPQPSISCHPAPTARATRRPPFLQAARGGQRRSCGSQFPSVQSQVLPLASVTEVPLAPATTCQAMGRLATSLRMLPGSSCANTCLNSICS